MSSAAGCGSGGAELALDAAGSSTSMTGRLVPGQPVGQPRWW